MQNNTDIYKQDLTELAELNGIELTPNQVDDLINYMIGLTEANKKVNLTRIEEPKDFLEKHIIDSLVSLKYIKGTEITMIDVGTGGGFPGVPLAIMLPESRFLLLDATGKKLKAVEEIVNNIGLKNVGFVHARAEEAGKDPAYRDQFDYAISRAVAPMPILCELCLPFVKPSGTFLALKGKQYSQELNEAKGIIKRLGAKLVEVYEFSLKPSDYTRVIIDIKKQANTPEKYPRHFSQIKKSSK